MCRFLFLLVLVLRVTTAMSPPASAQQTRSIDVAFDAPAECGEADALQEVLRQTVRRSAPESPRIEAEIRVTRTEHGYHTVIRLHRGSETGARELDAANCELAFRAVVLVVGLALEELEDAVRTRTSVATRALTTPAEFASTNPDDNVKTDIAGAGLYVSAATFATVGALPNIAGGLRIGLSASLSRLQIRADFAWVPRANLFTAEQPASGGAFSQWFTSASLGYPLLLGRLHVVPNIGVQFGELLGRGVGVVNSFTVHARWVALSLGVLLRVAIFDWLAAQTFVELASPLERPEFQVDGVGTLYRVAPVSAGVALGLAARIL